MTDEQLAGILGGWDYMATWSEALWWLWAELADASRLRARGLLLLPPLRHV